VVDPPAEINQPMNYPGRKQNAESSELFYVILKGSSYLSKPYLHRGKFLSEESLSGNG
jgi:hypothetical protein